MEDDPAPADSAPAPTEQPTQDAAPAEPAQPLQDFVPRPGLKDFNPRPAMRGGQEPPETETTTIDLDIKARTPHDED